MLDCQDRFIVETDGNLRNGALWDYGTIIESLRPGRFLIRMCADLLTDLLREPGVVEVTPMKQEGQDELVG